MTALHNTPGVGLNGERSPWRVKITSGLISGHEGRPNGSIHVIRVADGEIVGRYEKLRPARLHLKRLLRGGYDS